MQEHIRKLRELTESLPPVPKLIKVAADNCYAEYETESGFTAAFKLVKEPEVAVAKAIFSPDTTVTWHIHDNSKEWLIVYAGSITVLLTDNTDRILKVGESITLMAGEIHSIVSKKGARVIAITIPADETFPE